jgi:hypothetical protein
MGGIDTQAGGHAAYRFSEDAQGARMQGTVGIPGSLNQRDGCLYPILPESRVADAKEL